MILEFFDVGGKDARVVAATRVVIRDDFGNPIAFAVNFSDPVSGTRGYHAATADDPRFEALLTALGVKASRVKNRIVVET